MFSYVTLPSVRTRLPLVSGKCTELLLQYVNNSNFFANFICTQLINAYYTQQKLPRIGRRALNKLRTHTRSVLYLLTCITFVRLRHQEGNENKRQLNEANILPRIHTHIMTTHVSYGPRSRTLGIHIRENTHFQEKKYPDDELDDNSTTWLLHTFAQK